MSMEIHKDKIIMRAPKYNLHYVMTKEDVELLQWALSTINSFTEIGRAHV